MVSISSQKNIAINIFKAITSLSNNGFYLRNYDDFFLLKPAKVHLKPSKSRTGINTLRLPLSCSTRLNVLHPELVLFCLIHHRRISERHTVHTLGDYCIMFTMPMVDAVPT